jgi:hypothetical protein
VAPQKPKRRWDGCAIFGLFIVAIVAGVQAHNRGDEQQATFALVGGFIACVALSAISAVAQVLGTHCPICRSTRSLRRHR